MNPFTLLDRLREPHGLRVLFQPIVHLVEGEPRLYALEALTRGPRGTSLERADVLFEYVRRKGQEAMVDVLCMREALTTAARLQTTARLSLNVHGSTVTQRNFCEELLDFAAEVGFGPRQLVLEIVEHRPQWPQEVFASTLEQLRACGVAIALDDLGVGASNYRLLIDCRPDYLKVDRYLVQGCAHDRYRQVVLQSIVGLAAACGAVPIAEGVEDEGDLHALRKLGFDHFQGWLWAPALSADELADSHWTMLPLTPAKEESR
jgi:EAL domain-containing protein (putative c-di-GMP-specific phosphodiesterase class I)